MTRRFFPYSKACEQKERTDKKNADRPRALIEQRARAAATKAGASFEFFWSQMNYQSLVPIMRACLSDEGICQGCGHKFLNERDVQIEHLAVPRDRQDWARLHTRNIRIGCGSCNLAKSDKAFEEWLDEQEDARRSNLQRPSGFLKAEPVGPPLRQGDLFDLGGFAGKDGRDP